MKNFMVIMLTTLAAGVVGTAAAQSPRAWVIGAGGTVWQFNRVPQIDFTSGAELDRIDVKVRHAVWGGHLMAARELSNVFSFDLQGHVGTLERKMLAHVSLGLQWRLGHYFRSPWIDPYLRVGAGYIYKDFHTSYAGEKNGVGYQWWNVRNKSGADQQHALPLSAGAGVDMWLNDHLGIGLAGDYLYILKNRVANPLQGSVRLLLRWGGASKRPAPVIKYVDRPVEKIVERVVERVVEVEVPGETMSIDLNELLSNIHFDFDRHDIRPEYEDVLDAVARHLLTDTTRRWLLQGYTDAKGSSDYNESLSERRVQAILEALLQRGVPSEMLKAYGQGKRAALLPPHTADHARMGDRKVTIEIVGNMEYWESI